jgi:citrate synthase
LTPDSKTRIKDLKYSAVCKSKISSFDNEKLYYRGYDVEELVQRSTFLEVAYLLIYGELPDEVFIFTLILG